MKRILSGLPAWIVQRFTAVCMFLFLLFTIVHFVFSPPQSYSEWHDWITSPFISIATILFFISLLLHAWIGIRDVSMDYVHSLPLRLGLLVTLTLVLVGLALWLTRILLLAKH